MTQLNQRIESGIGPNVSYIGKEDARYIVSVLKLMGHKVIWHNESWTVVTNNKPPHSRLFDRLRLFCDHGPYLKKYTIYKEGMEFLQGQGLLTVLLPEK